MIQVLSLSVALVTGSPLEAAGLGAPAVSPVTWCETVRGGLAAAEYHARHVERGLQAPNRAHDLRTWFEPAGIRVQSRTAAQSTLVRLSLARFGRGSNLVPVSPGEVTHDGSRVEIRRPGLVEWYENAPRGLEQGFTLEAAPPGDGDLVLELALEGAQATPAGEDILFDTSTGRKLRYAHLVVFDDCHDAVPAWMEVTAPRRIRLVVDDAEATYPLVVDPLLSSAADTVFESNQPDPPGFLPAAFGWSVSSAGDVNDDGFDDVLVGAFGWDGGDPHEGAAFVFLGSADGIVGTNPDDAHARIESNQFGAHLGSVAGAGDVNGDGYDDIVVGAHFYEDVLPFEPLEVNGAVFVFHGSADGITGTDPTNADTWIRPSQLFSDFGLSVAGAGDVNNDGYDDIVVSAPRQGVPFPPPVPPNQGQGDLGMVLVYHGGPAGIDADELADANTIITPYPPDDPSTSYGYLGGQVAGAGDVNGDGYDDIIIAGLDTTVFLGSETGIVGTDFSNAHARISGEGGLVSGAGDVNGDGFDDVIIGGPFLGIENSTTQEGGAYVFLGSASGISATSLDDAHASFFGNLLAEWVGFRVAGAGDVDADGYDDLLIAARSYPGSLFSEGGAYLFRGGPTGLSAESLLDADVRLDVPQSGAIAVDNNYAVDVAAAGDVNGDGYADVLFGKGYYDAGHENEGAAFLFHGHAWPDNPNVPPVAKAGFDLLYHDFDGDGLATVTLDGCGSYDPDGSVVGFAWYEGETLLGTSSSLTTELPITGDHEIVLAVTDDEGLTRGDPVTVRVEPLDSELTFSDGFEGGLGTWSLTGLVQNVNLGNFPDPPQVQMDAGSSMRHTITLVPGATGATLSFWGRAPAFAADDQVKVRIRTEGGAFETVFSLTPANASSEWQFYGGSLHPIGISWFPATASDIEIEFDSATSNAVFQLDVVQVRAIIGPGIVDADGDGEADATDGCPDDPNKTEPGVCGCGAPDVDPDGDGVVNCNSGACGDNDGGGNPCPIMADTNCDNVVDVNDLLAVVLGWGTCPAAPEDCPADTNDDGVVDINDLLSVILNWT